MRATRRTLLGAALLFMGAATVSMHARADQPVVHHAVIHVGVNESAAMNNALNYATNVAKFYADKGEQVRIEVHANGPGLHMLRADTSPVKGRLLVFAARMPQVTFTGCNLAKQAMQSAEGKEITLIAGASTVPAGAVHLIELQEQGWSYLKP